MTSAQLAKICSDVTRKRMSKEITLMVEAGLLERKVELYVSPGSIRELRLTPTARARLVDIERKRLQ